MCTMPKSVAYSPDCLEEQKICGSNPSAIAALVVERKNEEWPPVSEQGSLPAMNTISLAIDADEKEQIGDHPIKRMRADRERRREEERFGTLEKAQDRLPDSPVTVKELPVF